MAKDTKSTSIDPEADPAGAEGIAAMEAAGIEQPSGIGAMIETPEQLELADLQARVSQIEAILARHGLTLQ